MKIQIIGPGCPKCRQLAANAEQAAREAGCDAEIEKVTDLGRIMDLGVMLTPALAVDGQVKVSGHVASVEEIKALLG